MSKVSCPTHPKSSWVNKGQLLHAPSSTGAERTRVPPVEPPPPPPASAYTMTTPLACYYDKFMPADDDVRSTSTSTGWGSETDDGDGSETFNAGTPQNCSASFLPAMSQPPGLTLARADPPVSAMSANGFVPPPGLPPPASFAVVQNRCTPAPPPGFPAAGVSRPEEQCVVAPPGLGGPSKVKVEMTQPYTPQGFRRDIMALMRALSSHRNVAQGVREVRSRKVPKERQAAEFADILTFAMEETRGAARRTLVAFVAGLFGAFAKEECVSGLRLFFDSVYPDLCDEVPKLAKLIKLELIPTLSSVLSAEEIQASFPAELVACG